MLVKLINDQSYFELRLFLTLNQEDPFNSNTNIKKKKEEAANHRLINLACRVNFGHLEIQNFST